MSNIMNPRSGIGLKITMDLAAIRYCRDWNRRFRTHEGELGKYVVPTGILIQRTPTHRRLEREIPFSGCSLRWEVEKKIIVGPAIRSHEPAPEFQRETEANEG